MRPLLAAALFATAALPAEAATLDRECRAIRALTNGDGRNFADLNFEASPRARLQLRVGRGRAVVGRAALQDEPLVAIAAVDEALLVDLEIDPRMAERRMGFARPVAGDPGSRDIADLGGEAVRLHGAGL